MAIDRDQLLGDLRRLRRGSGLADARIQSYSPSLRGISGASPEASDQDALEALRVSLDRLVDALPAELGQFARAALNVGWDDDGASELLEGRIARLSELVSRDPRTVRRRIEEATNRLVDIAIAEENWAEMDRQESGEEWYVKSIRAILRLDLPAPEAIDEREIAVQGSSLGGISLPFTLPRHPYDHAGNRELLTDMLFGGKFLASQRVSDSRFDIKVQFPHVVQPGQTHRYAIIYRIPEGQPMAPHYVHVPYRRCDNFELLVRFSQHAIPADIRRITAAFHREIEDRQPDTEVLHPDSAGEVNVRFANLRVGFAYGLQWQW